MTTINPLYASLYSQLSSQTQNPATVSPDLTSTLVSALDQDSGTSSNNSDIVDLSQQAQDYLSQNGATGSSSATTSSDNGDGFNLTADQINTINGVLAKYKDAPFTQATFDQIKADLTKAGVGPDQLAAEDSINSFNITQILINALNGTDDGTITISTPTDPDEQAKSDNYVKQLINAWGSISTTVSSSSASAPTDGSAAPAA